MNKSSFDVEIEFDIDGLEAAWTEARQEFLKSAAIEFKGAVRGLLKRGPGSSRPGQPPKTHTSRLVKSLVSSIGKNSCDVGSKRLPDKNRFTRTNGKSVAEILEFGGQVEFQQERQLNGKWRQAGLSRFKVSVNLPTRWKRIRILARPFLRPALALVKPRLAKLFKNTFRKG